MMFILKWDDGLQKIFYCNSCFPPAPNIGMEMAKEDWVMTYHSYQEAKKAGWIFTKCERFSPDGKAVPVCPECTKDIC